MGFGERSEGGFRGSFGPREMHKAVCADCGKECEVPFKPTEGKPVYCRDCYSKHRKF
jgi:CxxC-x17-CxxC domain-containing protein